MELLNFIEIKITYSGDKYGVQSGFDEHFEFDNIEEAADMINEVLYGEPDEETGEYCTYELLSPIILG